MNIDYYYFNKYLKYKKRYLELKGGGRVSKYFKKLIGRKSPLKNKSHTDNSINDEKNEIVHPDNKKNEIVNYHNEQNAEIKNYVNYIQKKGYKVILMNKSTYSFDDINKKYVITEAPKPAMIPFFWLNLIQQDIKK